MTEQNLCSSIFYDSIKKIGGGHLALGIELVEAIALMLEYAEKEHPVFADGIYQAVGVIQEEYKELDRTLGRESELRTIEEAGDVLVTALRLIRGDYHSSSDNLAEYIELLRQKVKNGKKNG